MDKKNSIIKLQILEQSVLETERRLASIDKTLAVNTQHLAEHMRRTEILEKELAPVTRHVNQMQGAGKFIFFASLIATILAAVFMVK